MADITQESAFGQKRTLTVRPNPGHSALIPPPLRRGFCLVNQQKEPCYARQRTEEAGYSVHNCLLRIVPRTHDFDAKKVDECAIVNYNGHHRR